jgi:hypothetical protein
MRVLFWIDMEANDQASSEGFDASREPILWVGV